MINKVIGYLLIITATLNGCLSASLGNPKDLEPLSTGEKLCDLSLAQCQRAESNDERAQKDCYPFKDNVMNIEIMRDCGTACASSHAPDQRMCSLYCADFELAGKFCDAPTTTITAVYTFIKIFSTSRPSSTVVALTLSTGSKIEKENANQENQAPVPNTALYAVLAFFGVIIIIGLIVIIALFVHLKRIKTQPSDRRTYESVPTHSQTDGKHTND